MGAEAEKQLSCGVLVINDSNRLLLMHAKINSHWDIPKGVKRPDETPLQAAIRETKEETGMVLTPSQLIDLGQFEYNFKKDLHLYLHFSSGVEIGDLFCNSYFEHEGELHSEASEYEFVPLGRAELLMCGSLRRLYERTLLAIIEDKIEETGW
ncbi:NUDIX domain-containing protein [Ferrimonas marina]|uniref:8-oxo-dGTP pyrophosphatase MutT, NUDIX family n=1 Tax=Ferrimonas marina TaxID=299255 RepID=A0A1M5T9P6_9GAMM|nr:NUDIX domain-containing protein [Ferrimonas marina]SHH47449.1 8-oxo-dGTP pyrophosphatase MutT, NUDIX family [Ferrimonas marina]